MVPAQAHAALYLNRIRRDSLRESQGGPDQIPAGFGSKSSSERLCHLLLAHSASQGVARPRDLGGIISEVRRSVTSCMCWDLRLALAGCVNEEMTSNSRHILRCYKQTTHRCTEELLGTHSLYSSLTSISFFSFSHTFVLHFLVLLSVLSFSAPASVNSLVLSFGIYIKESAACPAARLCIIITPAVIVTFSKAQDEAYNHEGQHNEKYRVRVEPGWSWNKTEPWPSSKLFWEKLRFIYLRREKHGGYFRLRELRWATLL